MKAVMISIQPKWVRKILSGEKTIEVRKTAPKIETPFKCYIYCSKGGFESNKAYGFKTWAGRGKVVGEFICDKITKYEYFTPYDIEDFCHAVPQGELEKTCLEDYELDEYLDDKDGYGWHISDLKIYDKPKEIIEFKNLKGEPTRAFQSWGYVEDVRI